MNTELSIRMLGEGRCQQLGEQTRSSGTHHDICTHCGLECGTSLFF
jgi:hypothetical protein